ncbi:MAG: hypothetical protein KGQ70_02150, partial [Alphaproteobacteria bacterium]|nr:hypothetical protein [Alphaproteobacteria bacterium]
DGNHEFRTGMPDYGYNFDFKAVEEKLRQGIARIPNAVYLRDKPFVKDGVAVIGRNGHWDYRIVDELPRRQAIREGRGLLKASFNEAASFAKLARRDYYALRDQVVKFNRDSSIHTIVVVTHTVPRAELIDFRDNVPLAKYAQRGTSLMRNLVRYDAGKKLKFWLFGHQHGVKRQEMDGVVYQANTRGYPDEGIKDYRPSTLKFGT